MGFSFSCLQFAWNGPIAGSTEHCSCEHFPEGLGIRANLTENGLLINKGSRSNGNSANGLMMANFKDFFKGWPIKGKC